MRSAPQIIAAMLAWGMGVAFVRADRDSPTSRALSAFLFSIGVSIFVISQFDMPMRVAGPVQLQACASLALKGFSQPVPRFALNR